MRRFAAIAVLMLTAPALVAAQPAPQPAPKSTRAEIHELRAELARIAASGPRNTAQVAAAKAKLQALNARETAMSVRLGQDRNKLAKLLSALQLFRRSPPPALLVRPEDARDAVRAAILIRAMTPELERRAAALSSEAKAMAALRREAAAANADLFSAESAVAEQRADIERLLEDEAADDLDDNTLFARSPGALITTLPATAEAGTLARLKPPVQGPVLRRYGEPLPSGARSPGISFAAAPGATVRAPAQGVVEFAGPVAGWGVVVIVRGAGSHHLVLAGLTQATVAPGQSVASGAPVGRMADRGQSSPELYLEVREKGVAVDPSRWLAGTSQQPTFR